MWFCKNDVNLLCKIWSKCLPKQEWMNKSPQIHTIEHYVSVKENNLEFQELMWKKSQKYSIEQNIYIYNTISIKI